MAETALCPELEALRQQTEAASDEARALCEGLSEQQLAWRPAPGRWCIAENLLHLERTVELVVPSLDAAIADARAKKLYSNGPFRLTAMGRFFVWYVEPPPAIRLPAPKVLRPLLEGPAMDVLPRFLRSQQAVLRRFEEANGLHLNRARFVSPFASFVRMDLLALFNVFVGHTRRHLWQAGNVRRELPGTPASST